MIENVRNFKFNFLKCCFICLVIIFKNNFIDWLEVVNIYDKVFLIINEFYLIIFIFCLLKLNELFFVWMFL